MFWTWVKMTVYGVETRWLSDKQRVLSAEISKKDPADRLLPHEMTHYDWFPWKRCNCNQFFALLTPFAKFILFIEWPLYKIVFFLFLRNVSYLMPNHPCRRVAVVLFNPLLGLDKRVYTFLKGIHPKVNIEA